MANIILFSHGQLATGLADSCKLIIGENHFKVLNILLDQNIQEIKNNLDVMIQSFGFIFCYCKIVISSAIVIINLDKLSLSAINR